jgi:hypothetical protein
MHSNDKEFAFSRYRELTFSNNLRLNRTRSLPKQVADFGDATEPRCRRSSSGAASGRGITLKLGQFSIAMTSMTLQHVAAPGERRGAWSATLNTFAKQLFSTEGEKMELNTGFLLKSLPAISRVRSSVVR